MLHLGLFFDHFLTDSLLLHFGIWFPSGKSNDLIALVDLLKGDFRTELVVPTVPILHELERPVGTQNLLDAVVLSAHQVARQQHPVLQQGQFQQAGLLC